jgi:Protein of unknown function (DUF4065)
VVFDRTDIVGLVQALLCRARQREGFTTKTKLVKYLYLADVEHYRRTGKQLTGFRWIFHHYGPWSVESTSQSSSLTLDRERRRFALEDQRTATDCCTWALRHSSPDPRRAADGGRTIVEARTRIAHRHQKPHQLSASALRYVKTCAARSAARRLPTSSL